MDCEGNKTDPTFAAHEMPITQYAKACFEAWLPKDILAKTHAKMDEEIQQSANKWGSVRGPIAATILTVQRLGWEFKSATELVTGDGDTLDLCVDSPAFVSQEVTKAARKLISKEIDEAFPTLKSNARGPIISGVRKALAKGTGPQAINEKWTAKCKPSLRSALCNGQWTQSRLCRAGLAKDGICRLCLAVEGTPAHRHCCKVTELQRGQCTEDKECDSFVQKMDDGARHLLATRGLLAATSMNGHAPNKEGTLVWDVRPEDGVLPSDCVVYTDGSMIDGPTKSISRVGFGFVAYDGDGNVVAKAYGTPPAWIDTVPGAETWAVAEAMRHSVPGIASGLIACRLLTGSKPAANLPQLAE